MKKGIKLALICALTVLLVFVTCIFSTAEESGEKVIYTIELQDGTVTEYKTTVGFVNNVKNAPSGSIITLSSNIELVSGIEIYGSAAEHKEITIDLAGYGLYSKVKDLVATMIAAKDYSTVNVTSSKPDAFLYMIDTASNSTKGGNVFHVSGKDALMRVGGNVTLKGEKYPGSNISTFSSCFADVRREGTVGFDCDGGQHFANIADWMGFITPRNGSGTITIKNANILVEGNSTLIHSEESSTSLYLENCLIIRLDGSTKYMFNQIQSSVVIKNCVTNYSMVAQNASATGIVTLEGKNVFGAGLGFDANLLKDGAGKIAARTNASVELVQGGKGFWRYDNAGNFNKLQQTVPELNDAYEIVSAEDTFSCTWQYDGQEKRELWVVGEKPTAPFSILASGKDGMYKKGWLKTHEESGSVIFKSTYVNDFDIKVRAEYENEALCYLIYVPAFVFDDAYISYAEGKIDGVGFSSRDWVEKEIDGKSYYEYTTMNIDGEDIDRVLEISLPCDMVDGNKLVKTEGIYRINLSKYLSAVHENESEYSEEQMKLIRELENKYFPQD